MKFYRAVLIGICLLATAAFLVLYFTQNAMRGKARIDPSRFALEFDGPQQVASGSIFDLKLRIIPPTDKIITAATIVLEYDSDYLELVGYGTDTACAVLLDRILPVTLPKTEEFVLTKVKDIDSPGVGTPFCFEHLRFRAKTEGLGIVQVKAGDDRTAAVGLSAATDRFAILDDMVNYNVLILSGSGVDNPTNTPAPGGVNPTNTPRPGNVTNTPTPFAGGGGNPTNTPAPGGVNPTNTPRPGNVTNTPTPFAGGGGNPTNTPAPGGVNPTNTPRPGNVTNTPTPFAGGGGNPTNTPVPGLGGVNDPTPTIVSFADVTPRPGQVGIKLRIKFQGITTLPGQGSNRQRVGVAVGGGRLKENTEYYYDEFIAVAPGIFEGVVIFPQDILKPGTGYKILVKGPKQLAKRFCAPDANDAKFGGDGKYFCSSNAGAIELREGINTFDFTRVYLLAGDLKVNGVQDGVVDAVDLAFVRQNLSKVEQGAVKIGDINLDMVVDTQDYSLILSNTINNEDEN